MTEENQPAELPDYLRDASEDADKTLDEEVDAAKAWAEAFAESDGDSDTDPEADPQTETTAAQPDSDPVDDSETQGQSTTVGSENDENLVTSQAPAMEEDTPAPEPEPEPDPMSDTSTQAWSSFLNEETMAKIEDSQTDVVDSDDRGSGPAQPAEELETTVVRRKSLLGTETETTPLAGAAPTDTTGETPEEVDPQWQPRQPELLGNEDKKLNESTMLAGASIKPAKISRAGAHAWSLLISLIGVPLAWAFLRHAGGLLYGSNHSAWDTGKYSVEGLVFLILGLVALIVIGSFVRLSSLGMFVSGILFTVLGGAFVVVPGAMKSAVGTSLQGMQDSPVMALKVLGYLIESAGASGQFLVIGVMLIMIGVVGHSARRKGRVDQIADKALARAENA
ncbi:hypothetical protein [uncultured Mobiluncus sp.]|uniref:hypothetical protein n=1 Tax=uncultured Mobiluncus sp. TaxID=293425 RepID=UPI0025F4326A|nr:hypothetical protein [uncultured Mobiluncus sp.]